MNTELFWKIISGYYKIRLITSNYWLFTIYHILACANHNNQETFWKFHHLFYGGKEVHKRAKKYSIVDQFFLVFHERSTLTSQVNLMHPQTCCFNERQFSKKIGPVCFSTTASSNNNTLLPISGFVLDEKFQWNASKFAIFYIYENL